MESAVLRGVARSALAYTHYDRTWWGRDPRIRVLAIHIEGARAQVMLAARGVRRQHLRLARRTNGSWDVVSTEAALIVGPMASRRASRRETLAIVAAWRAASPGDACEHRAWISTVDPRFALLPAPCPRGEGNVLLRKDDGRWRVVSAASDPFMCRQAPPGVIRSLDSTCVTG